MNEKLYEELMHHPPSQQASEWHLFLQLCEMYLNKYSIKKPIVVEIGILRGRQRPFYEQLFNAEWIGIDIREKRNPTILGNSHLPQTMTALRKKLDEINGPHELGSMPIDILFIDGGHRYADVRQDFEDYSPLCSGIIAVHDTEMRMPNKGDVRFFWQELEEWSQRPSSRYADSMFINLHQYRSRKAERRVGIGMIRKR